MQPPVQFAPSSPRVALVTGASSGIGRATALALAQRGVHVVLACRDRERGTAVKTAIELLPSSPGATLLLADFASLGSVRSLAMQFRSTGLPLHALINNAATLSKQRSLTADGLERTFQVNYLSHFLLTHWLLDRLRSSAPARIVNVGSDVIRAFAHLDLEDLQLASGYGEFRAYRQSKVALMLFTRALAQRERACGVSVNCVHPGNVRTHMTARGFFIDLIRPLLPSVSAEYAAESCANLALNPEWNAVTGAYVNQRVEQDPGRAAQDEAMLVGLWSASWQLTQPFLPPPEQLAWGAVS